jgi:hypothetical protein
MYFVSLANSKGASNRRDAIIHMQAGNSREDLSEVTAGRLSISSLVRGGYPPPFEGRMATQPDAKRAARDKS